jgi:hypothetical protein
MNARSVNARSVFAALAIGAMFGCNTERKQECDQFLTTMKPLEGTTPSGDAVQHIQTSIEAIQFQDQPLREYALSTKTTLRVLANGLNTQASDSPPDGTDDLVKSKLREARVERDDVARYCAQ